MRLLVTGTTGQLAMSLVVAPPAGVETICIGRPDLDLARPSTVYALLARHRPDIVVNAAAYTAVDKAESEPDLAMAVNAAGAEAVAAACAKAHVPVIHLSTDYVFDGSKAAPYVETDVVGPTSAYGRSKLEGEMRVRAACARHVILRTAWVYSPFGNNFVKTMLRLATTRSEISVVDDQLGTPTYAPSLAAAIYAIVPQLVRGDGPTGTYHAAGTGETTWCGFAREVFRISAAAGGAAAVVKPITTAEYPTPARRPANSRLDCGLLARDFGVVMPHWHDGVSACVARLLAAQGASGRT